MRRAFLGLLFGAALAAQPASIEGTVLDRANGKPLADVHVRLLSGDFSYGAVVTAYGAMSDRAGHFSIASINAGLYLLYPECDGFVFAPRDNTTNAIPLKSGQHLVDFKIEMAVRATISGRVLDEYGDPVQNIAIELNPLSSSAVRDLPYGWTGNSTNDLGEFRLLAAPGRYYLYARLLPSPDQSAPEIRTDRRRCNEEDLRCRRGNRHQTGRPDCERFEGYRQTPS